MGRATNPTEQTVVALDDARDDVDELEDLGEVVAEDGGVVLDDRADAVVRVDLRLDELLLREAREVRDLDGRAQRRPLKEERDEEERDPVEQPLEEEEVRVLERPEDADPAKELRVRRRRRPSGTPRT